MAAAGAGAAALLYAFPPDRYGFYPPCPFYALTHHYCPGCGATRALSALLHGNVAAAMHFNPLTTVLLPLLAAFFAVAYWRTVRENRMVWPQPPRWTWSAALLAVLFFALLRNFLQPVL
ncbi:MAG TPA: DUF2752 domain-containing protein [Dongiaceae bacterium]|nr:DUF2752 domain-containing protein [Dongiaceae bacterium]